MKIPGWTCGHCGTRHKGFDRQMILYGHGAASSAAHQDFQRCWRGQCWKSVPEECEFEKQRMQSETGNSSK